MLASNHREALLDKEGELSSLREKLRVREAEISRMREEEAQRASFLQNAIMTYVQGSPLSSVSPRKWTWGLKDPESSRPGTEGSGGLLCSGCRESWVSYIAGRFCNWLSWQLPEAGPEVSLKDSPWTNYIHDMWHSYLQAIAQASKVKPAMPTCSIKKAGKVVSSVLSRTLPPTPTPGVQLSWCISNYWESQSPQSCRDSHMPFFWPPKGLLTLRKYPHSHILCNPKAGPPNYRPQCTNSTLLSVVHLWQRLNGPHHNLLSSHPIFAEMWARHPLPSHIAPEGSAPRFPPGVGRKQLPGVSFCKGPLWR